MTPSDTSPTTPLRIYGNLSLVEMAPVLLAADRFYDGPTHIEHGGVMALWGEGSDLASLSSSGQADIALNTETHALRGAAARPGSPPWPTCGANGSARRSIPPPITSSTPCCASSA